MQAAPGECKAEGAGNRKDLAAAPGYGSHGGMVSASESPVPPSGRVVTAETLAVAPEVLGRPLAEPWRRLAGMGLDLLVVGALSLLAKPFLGLATGVLLLVLLGNSAQAAMAQKVVRWVCRAVGAVVIVLAVLALGHVGALFSGRVQVENIADREPSAVAIEQIVVPPNASYGELQSASRRLSAQVERLRAENEALRGAKRSWVYQTRSLVESMGVTFGWAGVYFTLIAGLTNGRSAGKFLVRTRAVKVNGQPLKFFDAFIRQGGYVAGVAMGLIGFLKLLWEPNRQAVEDRIASTVVVKV